MTYGLGLGVIGILLLYTGIKNLSVKQAVQGDNTSNTTSSASQFASLALAGNGNTPGATDSAPGDSLPRGVSIPKASYNPLGKPIANWIIPYLDWASKNGWTGHVNSGYRTRAEQTAIYNSGVRPAAKPGTSNHEQDTFPGGAVDVTDASQLSAILAKYPGKKLLQWAGSKDPVHFSNPHNGGY